MSAIIMTEPPERDARRVFWIPDFGSAHRDAPCSRRLQAAYPTLVPVHGPALTTWLHQVEIYFSGVEWKVLTPMDVLSLAAIVERLPAFERYSETLAPVREDLSPAGPGRAAPEPDRHESDSFASYGAIEWNPFVKS